MQDMIEVIKRDNEIRNRKAKCNPTPQESFEVFVDCYMATTDKSREEVLDLAITKEYRKDLGIG